MSTKQIHVFISHSWSYSGHYDTLEDWIFNKKWSSGQASLDFRDFSIPRTDPILNANNDLQLKKAIFEQIARCHVVVIPTGMYAQYSKWIQKEIEGSVAQDKPILAVNPWGQQRTASVVADSAKLTVGWNSQSVADGIWQLYKQCWGS